MAGGKTPFNSLRLIEEPTENNDSLQILVRKTDGNPLTETGNVDYVDKASISDDKIPLPGTEEGKPITGDLEFAYPEDAYIFGSIGLNKYSDYLTLKSNELDVNGNYPAVGFDRFYIPLPSGVTTEIIASPDKGFIGGVFFDKQNDPNAFSQIGDIQNISSQKTFSFNNVSGDLTPVLYPSVSGWDQNFREIGNTIYSGSRGYYIKVYSGFIPPYSETGAVYVGIATSTDGITWTKRGSLADGQAFTFTYGEDPYIVEDASGLLHIYYENKTALPQVIGHATTMDVDGTWTNEGMVLGSGTAGSFDEMDASSPTVIKITDTNWEMAYEGRMTDQALPDNRGRILKATSTNAGMSWTKTYEVLVDSSIATWSTSNVPDDWFKVGDEYFLSYHGEFMATYYFGMAISKDRTHFSDYFKGYFSANNVSNGTGLMMYQRGNDVVFDYTSSATSGILTGIASVKNFDNWEVKNVNFNSGTLRGIVNGNKNEYLTSTQTANRTIPLKLDNNGYAGVQKIIVNPTAFTLTVTIDSGVTLDGGTTGFALAPNQEIWLLSLGNNAWKTLTYTTKGYVDSKIAQTITNGVTDSAPSQDAVSDALALKANLTASNTFSGVSNIFSNGIATTTITSSATADRGSLFFGGSAVPGSFTRNLADAVTAFRITNNHTSSTGNIADFSSNIGGTTAVRATIPKNGVATVATDLTRKDYVDSAISAVSGLDIDDALTNGSVGIVASEIILQDNTNAGTGLYSTLDLNGGVTSIAGSTSIALGSDTTNVDLDINGLKISNEDNKPAYYNADYSANYTSRSLVDKEYVDGVIGDAVLLTGDQSVLGIKTFSTAPFAPSALSDGQLVNLGQLESYTASIVNTTVIDLTSADLNSSYPNVPVGYRVICPDIALGALIYTKTSEAGSSDVWVSTTATIVA